MIATLLAVVTATDVDWLIKPPTAKATFKRECWPEYKIAGQAPCGFALANGLTSRVRGSSIVLTGEEEGSA